MAHDLGTGRRSVSPESSGRDSPIQPQWRNQLDGAESVNKDKNYRKYALIVDKTLSLFDTTLEEWADYISFLNKLLKSLQSRPSSITRIPSSTLVAKRLSQCLDPSLPSGVHQKALEVYSYVFATIGQEGLSRSLPVWLPGLAPTLSFASLSVRTPFLDILEEYFLRLHPNSLRPAMRSIIMALLPGIEEETSEDFERTLKLLVKFKESIRPEDSGLLTDDHSTGDQFFWQCFFLASITGQSRRAGALAYLSRYLPVLGDQAPSASAAANNGSSASFQDQIAAMVTSPEPGLLIRCFATGLADEQLLIQRGFLDLLVTHLPLSCSVLQRRIKASDLELLLKAAVGVVTRREMSLNRRLWAWFLGPEPASGENETPVESQPHNAGSPRTAYFEEYGLQPLIKALLAMIQESASGTVSERARPYRICLSLMDRWEVGGLVVPEVFLPLVDNVRQFKHQAKDSSEFNEVLRSASVFFDGIESGLIYGELLGLLAQAMGSDNTSLAQRVDKVGLVSFILEHFNVHEEEMITVHAPLCCLASLYMLQSFLSRNQSEPVRESSTLQLEESMWNVATILLDLIPTRAYPEANASDPPVDHPSELSAIDKADNTGLETLQDIKNFYVNDQGNVEVESPPLNGRQIGDLLLHQAVQFIRGDLDGRLMTELSSRIRFLLLTLAKVPQSYQIDKAKLLTFCHDALSPDLMSFSDFSSLLHLATQLRSLERISSTELSNLVPSLVKHAWCFLSASEPKYHVEAVRGLWHIQTALTLTSREVEAALATLIVRATVDTARNVDSGRTFAILWSHTLQDNASDRRGSRSPLGDFRTPPRLAGMSHFEVMLTQPLFLVLDSLLDERTQLFMTTKTWLNSMVGIDRLFVTFVAKFLQMNFLAHVKNDTPIIFSDDDDLELCLYYLRTLSNILRSINDVSRSVLATKRVVFSNGIPQISSGNDEGALTLQDFFAQVCVNCITGRAPTQAGVDLLERISELQRFALSTLHIFLSSESLASFSSAHLENTLIDRLTHSINNSDPFVQVLLLQVVHDTLQLRDPVPTEAPQATSDRRTTSMDPSRPSRASIALSETTPLAQTPPPELLKCLQAGLSSSQSRPVLDSWIGFLAQCLPFYSNTIFQVVIPLVETLCKQVRLSFVHLKSTFRVGASVQERTPASPESTLIYLLNGLEQVLAAAHDRLLAAEAHAQVVKSPEQPQSLFGSMVSNVWQSDSPQIRSATANDRLTVHLAFQDAVRMCYDIWSWGQGEESSKQDPASAASFSYTSLRMRNRARRLLEHLFHAEPLECLETVIDVWKTSSQGADQTQIFNLLSALDASRPRHTIPALFNAIYSRTNPGALEPWRKSTMTISFEDADLVRFLVDYAQSLDDDAMDEIWTDCITFLKDILSNPFPHRQTLPRLLQFCAILGEKVDNTNFGEQRRMRRELGDIFLRLLTALFTTRPMTFSDSTISNTSTDKLLNNDSSRRATAATTGDEPYDVVSILASVVPSLPKVLTEQDRVVSAAASISSGVIGPTIRAKSFPDRVSESTVKLLRELSRLQNNQKNWKKDVGEAFNDARFFGMNPALVKEHWLPLLRQWTRLDKEKLPEIVGRINTPSTAGIVFGVGATSARLESDRKTQINLRRIATIILASPDDTFVGDLPLLAEKLVELLAATATSSPSSTTRSDVYMVVRAMVLRTSPIHLAALWPIISAELHAAISSVVAPDNSTTSDTFNNATVLQACKLLDLLICVTPDDFQLHEWLFITDTVDAIYRASDYQPVALVDGLSEELGHAAPRSAISVDVNSAQIVASSSSKQPLLRPGGIDDSVAGIEKREELVVRILRPFFSQLSIFAFESTYAIGPIDRELCVDLLLKDIFDESSIVRAF